MGELDGGMEYILWELGCAITLNPCCLYLFPDNDALSSADSSTETNVLAMIPSMHMIK